MGWIALEGMQFHGFHGVYAAERVLGTTYTVDISIKAKTGKAAKSDDLAKTINYETVFQICRLEMEKPRNLIEAVLESIVKSLKHQFTEMQALKIKVTKQNPPLGGLVAASSISEEYNFMSECPRCKSKFINYDEDDCWDRHTNLHPATKETLLRQYNEKCLCLDCISFYAG